MNKLKFKQCMASSALLLAMDAMGGAQAACGTGISNCFVFKNGTFATAGTPGVSWFSMLASDTDSDGIADANVYTGMRGTNTTLTTGTFDMGVAAPAVTGGGGAVNNVGNSVDRDWSFFSAWGAHFNAIAIPLTYTPGAITATAIMTGWTVHWNGDDINMGAGAPAAISAGVDGLWGTGDETMDYSAIVPTGSFAGVAYAFHLYGTYDPNKAFAPTLDGKTPQPADSPNTNAAISITFSEPMATATVTTSSFTVTTGGGGTICTSITPSNSNKTFTCDHAGMTGNTPYTVTITSAVTDTTATSYAGTTWNFTTAAVNDVTPPTVSARSPAPASTVVNSSTISIQFDKAMDTATAAAMTVTANGLPLPGSFSTLDNQLFTFAPLAGALPNSSSIAVAVPASVTGANNVTLAGAEDWTFNTTNVATASASGFTATTTGGAGGYVVSAEYLSASTVEGAAAGLGKSRPANVAFDSGFMKYAVSQVVGGETTLTLVFPADITGKSLYKYKAATGDFVLITEGLGLNQYRRVNSTTISLRVEDDGALDDDNAAGGAHTVGLIVDPLGWGTALSTSTPELPSSGGAGGGCTVNPNSTLDPTMLLMLLGSLGYLGWRRSNPGK